MSSSRSRRGTDTCRSMRSATGPESRARYASARPGGQTQRRAGIAVETAGARVAGAHQQGPRREARAHHRPGHVDATLLQRLPQRVEGRRGEGADLVEEQHAVMGEADLPGPREAPPADQPGGGDRVVGRAEGAPHDERAPGVEQAGDRVDARDLDGLFEPQGRQDPRHAAGEHRLAASRRADHEHRMPARGGDLERAAGGRPGPGPRTCPPPPPLRASEQGLRVERDQVGLGAALEQVDRAPEGGRAEDLDAVDQSRLGGVGARHDDPGPARPRGVLGHREGARHRAQRSRRARAPRPRRGRRRPPAGAARTRPGSPGRAAGRTGVPPCAGRPGRGWRRSCGPAPRRPG